MDPKFGLFEGVMDDELPHAISTASEFCKEEKGVRNMLLDEETFLLRTTDGELVLANLDIMEQWDSINLYWTTGDGSGVPAVWIGDDGGYEREVEQVYEYSGTGFADTFNVFKPYDREAFIRRVVQKRDKYYPGYESTQEILMRMEPT